VPVVFFLRPQTAVGGPERLLLLMLMRGLGLVLGLGMVLSPGVTSSSWNFEAAGGVFSSSQRSAQQRQRRHSRNLHVLDEESARSWLQTVQDRSAKLYESSSKPSRIAGLC